MRRRRPSSQSRPSSAAGVVAARSSSVRSAVVTGIACRRVNKVREGRPELYESIRARIPIGRLGQPEEVARAVTFLASPAASFCTAVNLVVDGGIISRIQY